MTRRPLIWLAQCWLLGNIIASTLPTKQSFLAATLGILILGMLKFTNVMGIKLMWVCMACLLLAGAQRLAVDHQNISQIKVLDDIHEQQSFSAEASGVIASEVKIDGARVSFTFQAHEIEVVEYAKISSIKESFVVQLTLAEQSELDNVRNWHRGQLIQLRGEISRPPTETNEGGFNYRQYLYYKKIHWIFKVRDSTALTIVENKRWTIFASLQLMDRARLAISAPLDQLFPSEQSGYLKGLILGIREELDPEQFRQFSLLGLTHILAISGLHVAVIMYMLTTLLKLFRLTKEKNIIVLFIFIPFYVLLTGGSPSILRAGLMAMIGLIAARLGKLKDGLHLIALAAIIITLVNPYYIHDISFQLSFIVTFGLIVGVPPIRAYFPKKGKLKWVYDLLAVTFVAQLISFPITIYYFNQFHILSFFANFLLVPFISSIVLPLGTVTLMISHFSIALAKPLAFIVHWCNEWSFITVQQLSKVQMLHTIWTTPPLWWIITWYCILLYCFRLFSQYHAVKQQFTVPSQPLFHSDPSLKQHQIQTVPLSGVNELKKIIHIENHTYAHLKKYSKQSAVFLIMVILLAYGANPLLLSRTAHISFIDVGQGDAALIRTPTGKYILIDGGGTLQFQKAGDEWKQRRDPYEVGKNVLVPLLMKRGVSTIDYLIISHLDSDHIGGLLEVLKTIKVKEIWWNGTIKEAADAQRLFELALRKGARFIAPSTEKQILIDKFTTVEMLWPLGEIPEQVQEAADQNEFSLVFYIHVYDTTLLFTGDIGLKSEEIIVEHLAEKNKGEPVTDIAIMKVAHHGSRYSTSAGWLSYFSPQMSVISVGQYNTYGHPHPDVISRLSLYNSLIRRTDTEGEVQFRITSKDAYYWKWK